MTAAQLTAVVVLGLLANSTSAAVATLTLDSDEAAVWRSVERNAMSPIAMQLELNEDGL